MVSDKTSEGAFSSPGRLQEVDINHIDYEICNDLYHGGIVYSVVLCVQMCLGAAKIVARATHPIFVQECTSRKGWIDATISKLCRLTGGLERIESTG
jgi:hypothetical protein